jgi:hypothetical protein
VRGRKREGEREWGKRVGEREWGKESGGKRGRESKYLGYLALNL